MQSATAQKQHLEECGRLMRDPNALKLKTQLTGVGSNYLILYPSIGLPFLYPRVNMVGGGESHVGNYNRRVVEIPGSSGEVAGVSKSVSSRV